MRYRTWSTMAALLALVMWSAPQTALAHGGGGGGGGGGGHGGGFGGGGFGGGHGGFGGGHMGGFGGGHMGGFGGHHGGMGGGLYGGMGGGHYGGLGGYSGLGGHHGGMGAGSLYGGGIGHTGIGHSGLGHSGTLGGSTLGGIAGHHAAGTVMHNPNSFTTHHLGGHQLTNGATGNHVISGYRGAGNNFAGTHAQGLLTHQATVGGHHSAFLQNHHVGNLTGTAGGHSLANTGTALGQHHGMGGGMGGQHHHGMGGNGYNGHHHNNFFFGYPFFGFGFPFFGYGFYGLGYGYGYGYPYYGYGYGYPYYYGYNPYAYSYGPYAYGYGAYASPYSSGQAAPTQQVAAGSDAEVFAQKGENDFKGGDYKAAVYAWRHAVLDDPQNGVLTLMLAQGLFAVGSFDEAAGAVQQGLQLLPEDQWGVVVTNYKELYGKVGNYTAQLRILEKAVKQQPDDPGLRFLLGYHYGFLGYPQHAVKQFDKALELAPGDQLAQKLRDQFNAKLPAEAKDKAPDDKEAGGKDAGGGQPNDRGIENKVTAK
jgi:hypothetical protein